MLADGLTDAYYSVAGYLKTFFPKKTTLVKQFSFQEAANIIYNNLRGQSSPSLSSFSLLLLFVFFWGVKSSLVAAIFCKYVFKNPDRFSGIQ